MNFLSVIGGAISSFFGVIVALIVIVIIVILLARGYIKAEPDEALIITGGGDKPKVVIGRSTIRIPFVQSSPASLTLRPIRVDLATDDWVPTSDFIGAKVTATVNVKVDTTDDDTVRLAAQHWADMEPAKIAEEIRGTLEGSMKEIIGKMELRDAATDRKKFGEEVLQSAQLDMKKLGLVVLTFNMKALTDAQGVVSAIGLENESRLKKSAAVAAAKARQEVREATALAEQEANKAENESRMIIAERENELRKKKAALRQESDTAQAQADIAYQLQEEEQRQELERRTVQADIARQEKEIELEEKRVAVEQKRLEAEVNKKADADKYKAEKEAEAALYQRTKNAEAAKLAQSNEAEAKLIVAKKEAEAQKAKAEAAKYAKLQEAEGIKAVGEAEAAAIAAKGDAEAEALDKKAEAMRKFEKAAMMEQILAVMPEIAREIAAPMANIDKVSIYGGGGADGSGFGAYGDAVPAMMGKLFDTMKDATGLDIVDLMHGDSQTAKVNRDINLHLDAPASKTVSKVVDEIHVDELFDDEKDDLQLEDN